MHTSIVANLLSLASVTSLDPADNIGTDIEDRMSIWFKFDKEKENDRYPEGSTCGNIVSLPSRQKHLASVAHCPLLCMFF
ncbi:hypothetical protein [Peribacillus simplex]|uniref:Uncharacterized protein n=1 Tax=Peribacillus simplex TaxID=1478 RepID=A0A8B5XUQ8_9BACI|nr:hypothetical protein [Peribacillus simplex]MEC1398413.1 hypothetical protein [Peribacillus simplex]MED3911597.1 hypothetical protein [Peribacillus simplex]MED3987654.1 hypothetical protein [Peribacillus simplex]MED4094692.1 hypothetical protein [Peribacillus simplex]TVX78191.1 hypothetical protein FQP34_20535 [Peribacillus simplex]